MSNANGEAILAAACFRMGVAGSRLTQAFADRIASLGLSHKQVGLLAVVDSGLARSQREIADRMRVAPSLVVSLVDRLIELDAVRRTRSTTDRRVQLIELTDRGRDLLAAGARTAAALDDDFRAGLSPAGRAALDTLLVELDARRPPTG